MKAIDSSAPPQRQATMREILQSELASRCARNAQYSLRAFARFLGIDHSTLSQLLRGRRPFTPATVERLGVRLGLEAELRARLAKQSDVATPRQLEITKETASILAEWQHYAILELTHLETFQADSRWVARVLGLSADEVNVAVQRLLRLGLMKMEGSRWIDATGDTSTSLVEFGEAVAIHLAAELGGADREMSSATFALNGRRLNEVRDLIARFRSELSALAGGSPEADAVYRVEISLFPVTRQSE